jgi:dihydroxyacetone kinase-like protein
MAGTVEAAQLADWLRRFRDAVIEHRAQLTELDSAIGDADHGTNMARGMEAVIAKVDAATPGAVDDLLKSAGMTLVSTVGGASGPLYGTFFLRMGAAGGGSTALDGPAFARLLRAGLDGVVARGKAERGDKTMIDAMGPAIEAFDGVAGSGGDLVEAAAAGAAAAARGRDATEPMQARKGRASYLGERSIGHLDPGAASTALLFGALAEALAEP